METTDTSRRFFVGGEAHEYWEDPAVPFRCAPEDLRLYAATGQWVTLFNALTLIGAPTQEE